MSARRKRLLSVIHGPVYGGGHTQMIRLRAPLERRGWETTALVPSEPGSALPRLREAGVETVSMPLHRLRATPDPRVQIPFLARALPEIRAIRRLLRERSIDLVQVHGDTNPHAAVAAHLERVAVVWQLYDTRTPVALRRLTMPYVVRIADAITTWGRQLAEVHPGATGLGERCLTVYPPVDASEFRAGSERRAEARRRLGIPADAIAVGTVGNRNPSKGHEWLIRAAERVRAAEPRAVFRVLGAPSRAHADYEEGLRREARERGLGDPVDFDLVDPGGAVAHLLPALDVFAVTSVPRSEGIPTVIFEAMATGIPVLATDVGAISEVVEEATGLLVPPEDAEAIAQGLLRLIRDPGLRQALAAESRRRVEERYDIEALAAIHARAYEIAVEHRRNRHAG